MVTTSNALALADQPLPDIATVHFLHSRSYLRAPVGASPIWFVCSPLDGVDQVVVGEPFRSLRGWSLRIAQPLSDDHATVYMLGPADPGAGQVNYALRDQTGPEVGSLHSINPDAQGDPRAAITPTFTSVRISGAQWNCRWMRWTRFLGFSKTRVVEVTSGPAGLEYQSFDFKDAGQARKLDIGGPQQSTTPSLDIKGGRKIGGTMRFDANGYSYRVTASASDARLVVVHEGRTILAEPMVAWTLGAP